MAAAVTVIDAEPASLLVPSLMVQVTVNDPAALKVTSAEVPAAFGVIVAPESVLVQVRLVTVAVPAFSAENVV